MPSAPRALPALLMATLLSCTGEIDGHDLFAPVPDPDAPGALPDPEDLTPPTPGLEFQCDAEQVPDPGPTLVRRLTVPQYVASVRAALGVDVGDEARARLPEDLRAEGFRNTTSALVVVLDHVAAFEALAEIAVSRMPDVAAFASGLAGCAETTDDCGRALIDALGPRVYRAPIIDAERAALLGLFAVVREEGDGFDVAAGLLLEAMLQSPRFLYRVEDETGDGAPREVSPHELASRLSYLVWDAPPDDALLDAARRDALGDDDATASEVDRMLADPRAREASLRFVDDWLDLGRLGTLPRDPERFPDWDGALGEAMRDETLAFMEHLIWETGGPFTDLFNAQETFLSGRLAEHYGLTSAGAGVMPYDLSAVPERGGLLTQGSLLTVGGNESSMVSRGKFLLETFLCGHLESPPPGIDTTPPEVEEGVSQRSHSEGRVENPSCGGCHAQMEPIAWGLERFDATGAHHLSDPFGNALLEDGYVNVPGESETQGYESIAALMDILASTERTRDCLTITLHQYAAGRPTLEGDGCTLAAAREVVQSSTGTYRDMLLAIATSPAFRRVRTE